MLSFNPTKPGQVLLVSLGWRPEVCTPSPHLQNCSNQVDSLHMLTSTCSQARPQGPGHAQRASHRDRGWRFESVRHIKLWGQLLSGFRRARKRRVCKRRPWRDLQGLFVMELVTYEDIQPWWLLSSSSQAVRITSVSWLGWERGGTFFHGREARHSLCSHFPT